MAANALAYAQLRCDSELAVTQSITKTMRKSVRNSIKVRRRFSARKLTMFIGAGLEHLGHFIGELNKRGKLHGIDHLVNKNYHPLERFLWLSLVLAAFYGVFYIGDTQFERYRANPTVISLERDYRLWNGTMPALTLCYHNRFDENKASQLIKRFWNVLDSDLEYAYFLDFIMLVCNTSMFTFKSFTRFAKDTRFDRVDLFLIAKDVHPDIKSIVSSFDPNFNPPIIQVMTERGICYTINAILATNLLATNAPGNYEISQDNPVTCSYKSNQCFMRLEVFDPTISYSVHSPYEIITQDSIFIDVGPTDEIDNTYDVVETIASPDLRALTPRQRRCLFYDESISSFSGYNVNICRLKCQAEAAIKLCGCRPHFYSFVNGTSCTPSGLVCLGTSLWPSDVTCKCPKTCSELVYTQNALKKTNWAADGELTVLNKKTSMRYEILAQKIRFRRDILFSFDDLIVSFGGIASLFLGYNFLNTSEMVYYIFNITIKYLYRKIYFK